MKWIFFVVAVLILRDVYGGAVDVLYKKISNNLTPFLTKDQVKKIGEKMGEYCIEQKTLESTASEIQSFVINKVLTTKQFTQATQLMKKMSDELGGMEKTTKLMNILVEEVAAQCAPYEKKTLVKCKKMKKSGKSNKKIINKSMKMVSNFLKPAVIQKAIDNIKKRFTPAQCDCAFKYLAPNYVKLGLYGFKKTPCTGNGV